jgi:hypothetical protein
MLQASDPKRKETKQITELYNTGNKTRGEDTKGQQAPVIHEFNDILSILTYQRYARKCNKFMLVWLSKKISEI